MKRKFFILSSLLFAFSVLGISVFRYSRRDTASSIHGPESMASVSADLKTYYLPYPGLLPDHPFYVMKMIRDRGRLVFQKTPSKKAILYIYYADKRIGAAEVLLKGNKVGLAETTAGKAEHYLGMAFNEIREMDENNLNVDDLWNKFYLSSTAHKEVILRMMNMVEGDARVSLEKLLEFCEVHRDEVKSRLGIEGEVVEKNNGDNIEEYDLNKGYL